jgi:flagellar biosynthetic protein FliR
MTAALGDVATAALLAFCRIGSCLMLVPGFASARVPAQVRLLIALAASLALTPLLHGTYRTAIAEVGNDRVVLLIFGEVAAGATIGLMARCYLLGLQFAATVATNAIGLAGIPGQPIDEAEAVPPLATLFSLGGVMVLFAAGMHIEMLRALTESYAAIPVRIGIDSRWFVENLAAVVADSTVMALRLAGPFVVYAVVVNVALGLANRFTPQISVYFASLGVVTVGGILILMVTAPQWLATFQSSYQSWLAAGSR